MTRFIKTALVGLLPYGIGVWGFREFYTPEFLPEDIAFLGKTVAVVGALVIVGGAAMLVYITRRPPGHH